MSPTLRSAIERLDSRDKSDWFWPPRSFDLHQDGNRFALAAVPDVQTVRFRRVSYRYPGSALIRISWLHAIKRRAEARAGQGKGPDEFGAVRHQPVDFLFRQAQTRSHARDGQELAMNRA